MNWIVLDIETVPLDLSDNVFSEYFASRGKLNIYAHPLISKIIHIGLKVRDETKHFFNEDENKLIEHLWSFLNDRNLLDGLKRNKYGDFDGNPAIEPAQLVTFNGDEFDIPFILFKSSIYKIPIYDLNLSVYPYRDLRKSNHFDCLRFISGPSIEKKIKLEIACKLLDIKFESCGVTGKSIKSLYQKGDFESIKIKNEEDLELTGKLYKKLLGIS